MAAKSRSRLYPDLLSMFNSVRGGVSSSAEQKCPNARTNMNGGAQQRTDSATNIQEIVAFQEKLKDLGASYDAVRAEAATASVSLEDVHADTDHLEADLRDARSKLRDLQKSDASRIVTSLRDTVERMNTKIAKQGTINDNVLADVCRLQETKATLADESFYCSGQIDQLQANLADAESFLQAQDGREATAEDRLQETTVSYKKRLSELQGETEQLKSERSVIGRKRKALAELRTRNRDMQAVVNLVKESLLNADDDESTGDATCNSIKHRRVRFENRA